MLLTRGIETLFTRAKKEDRFAAFSPLLLKQHSRCRFALRGLGRSQLISSFTNSYLIGVDYCVLRPKFVKKCLIGDLQI